MNELKLIGRHAGSVLVGQLAVMAFGVADTVIAGRHSDTALAALSVGSALYVSIYVGLMGIVQALLPIWGEMHGAGKYEAVGRSLRQSLYLCSVITVVGMTALLFPSQVLRWAQVPELMLSEVRHYLTVLAFAFAPSLLFKLYSSFNQSMGRPLLVTGLQLGAITVKIPLSVWLVHGGGGIEPLGAVGCAWATLAVNYMLLGLAVVTLSTQKIYKRYDLWRRIERPDWHQIGEFLRLGIPGGLAYMVEVTSFTLMALFIARLGSVATAGHQIAASAASLLYMVPLSIAIACSARVSFWLGANQPSRAKHVALLGVKFASFISIALATAVATSTHWLAGLYSRNPDVVAIGTALLTWVAFYHVADALQAVCGFLLRCYRITLTPLILYSVLLWGLGLYGGYHLAYGGFIGQAATQSASSFWATSTVALGLVAVGLMWLLQRTLHKSPVTNT